MIWLFLNLCHILRFLKCIKFLVVYNNFDESWKTGWLKFGTFQGYPHMAVLVKIAYSFN